MAWIQLETDKFENGSGWILERDGMFGWILYHEDIEDEFPDTFIVLSDLFTNPGQSAITVDPTTGKIPIQYMPAVAINDVFVVGSQGAMLATSTQRGDMLLRTDIPGPAMFILAGDDPTYLPNWIPVTTQFPDWSVIRNKPASFPPDLHNHDTSYYTKLEFDTALAGKRNNATPIPATEVTPDPTHRFVTDLEKTAWNNPPAPDWNTLSNKPASFPPDPHNHDSSYYTKTQVNTSLAGKRDSATPIPATDVTTDATHRFVTDAQVTAWNAAGLSNPLNQDINFATGKILKVNNVPVAGWLDDGTPFFEKRLNFTMGSSATSIIVSHGIANALTNNRIIGYSYSVKPSNDPTLNTLLGIPNGPNTPYTIFYDNNNLTWNTGSTVISRQFFVTLKYI
ncbi:hypothetical protein [Leptospira santarosai]|uniref:hypothetical protein n=1 Tax=Leptospira santarosai TaxID=28183 RepID=UPI0024AF7D4C|nr:hypothetical protein [Leptospira santarosai]MDI7215797.1 hypothetical protein [Leptospira santarosai]